MISYINYFILYKYPDNRNNLLNGGSKKFFYMISDWLDHTVKHVEVFKHSNVKAMHIVFGLTSVSVPFLSALMLPHAFFGHTLCSFAIALHLSSRSWATAPFLLCWMFLLYFPAVWQSCYIFIFVNVDGMYK